MEFEKVIRERTATRSFKDIVIEEEKLNKILEAGRLAPTAKNKQPIKILVVRSIEGISKIDKVSPCRYGAPLCLIVCGDKSQAVVLDEHSTYEVDASITATHMMLEATNVGVDNIWIERFNKDELKKEFNLPEELIPVVIIPLGYKTDDYAGNPLHTVRKKLDEIVEIW